VQGLSEMEYAMYHLPCRLMHHTTSVDCSLEMMDKMEPPAVADGYGLSVAFICMLDVVKSIQNIVQPATDSVTAPAAGPDVPSSAPSSENISASDTGVPLCHCKCKILVQHQRAGVKQAALLRSGY